MGVTQQRTLDSNSLWATLSASGTSDQFHLATHTNAILAALVTGVTGGSPSVQVFLDVLDPAGNWVQVVSLTAQTAPGVQSAQFTTSQVPGPQAKVARFRWTVAANSGVTVLLTAAAR